MFNSCLFNSVKFNSVCEPQLIIPPIKEQTGGIRVRERIQKRVFRTEFFDLIGTKLILSVEEFNIIGFILIARKLGITLHADTLRKVKTDLKIKGNVSYPFRTRQEILGFKKFKKRDYLSFEADCLVSSMQLQLLKGTKSIHTKKYTTIQGDKSLPAKQYNLIHGKKDISEILEALDLVTIEE